MSYQSNTIANVIDEIDARKIMLPSIQRKYVWEEDQITRLMDSIMSGYPFGTFLFWEVKKQVINDKKYPMYEFIKDYDERDSQNPHASQPFSLDGSNAGDTVYAILDGQQRLTSLYIALKGSLSKKVPKKRWDNPSAFPKKELYFNLLSERIDEEQDIKYEFAFLTAEDAQRPSTNSKIWYRVKDILQYVNPGDIMTFASGRNWLSNVVIVNNLTNLHQRLKCDELINYFKITGDSMDDVLDIFVRVNSGGTVLSKTDLLFSTIVAYWQDARDKIDNLLTHINKIGDHYEFNSDFIMRACLYVLDMPILMKVASFQQENVDRIKTNWLHIDAAIKDTVELLKELGFSSENIVSNNAILPIIYYRLQNGATAFADKNIKENFRKYFVLSQVKKIFSGHTNQTLDALRNQLREPQAFSFDRIKTIPLAYDRTLSCTAEDIEGWLTDFKKGPYTFLLLSLLYPDLKYAQEKFEQDHMHPHSGFSYPNLKKIIKNDRPLTSAEIADWQSKKDTLPNLQLLTSTENESKLKTTLREWMDAGNSDRYLPSNFNSYDFCDFTTFYDERKSILKSKLESILSVESQTNQKEEYEN